MNFKINESAQKPGGGYCTLPRLVAYLFKWVAETDFSAKLRWMHSIISGMIGRRFMCRRLLKGK